MKISTNKVVEFIYELEVEGSIVDRATKERPLDYIHGTGSILPKLEQHIEGMKPGDRFQITLQPSEAYGEVDPNRIIDLPKAAFEVNGEIREDLLVPGNRIPMLNSMGAVIPGIVLEVTEDSVKMDLNSEMAGKTLNFSGEIISVREATEKELKEGLHGEYLHSNGCGGCHSGGCGGCHGHDGEEGCHGHDGEGGCGCHDGNEGCHGHDGDGGCGCHHDGGCDCH
ncbi:MAG: peptidylprolyl isomerase [Candidatus Cryptobacteroides sp.]